MTLAGSAGRVTVEVLVAGEVSMPYGYTFRAQGNGLNRLLASLPIKKNESYQAPCLSYLVRHPDTGVVLIDTGFHPDLAVSLRRDVGIAMSLVLHSLKPDPTSFDQQLRARGVEPLEVKHVVMTHLHVDHTSGMRLLPNAEFAMAREEWAAARSRLALFEGYVPRHLPHESRVKLLDFERDGKPLGPFPKTIDLFDDGSMRLISTPGHTRGHMSVLLRLAGGRDVLVVGDAAYTLRNISEQRLSALTADDDAARRSLAMLKAFIDSEPGLIVIPTHDPEAWRRLEPVGAAGGS